MSHDFWTKQILQKPAFPDVLWSKPENKMHAGKLAIIGGHAQSFAEVAGSYTFAEKAGIGVVRTILPDALQKIIGAIMPEADFAPSTPSGSFARSSLATWLEHAQWADGVLVSSDLGRNSETAVVLESFLLKYAGRITLSGDAVDTYIAAGAAFKPKSTDLHLHCTFSQLQKLFTLHSSPVAITSTMDLVPFVEALHAFTKETNILVTINFSGNAIVSLQGQVSTTKSELQDSEFCSAVAVWTLQHPAKVFESATTAVCQV